MAILDRLRDFGRVKEQAEQIAKLQKRKTEIQAEITQRQEGITAINARIQQLRVDVRTLAKSLRDDIDADAGP